MEPKEIALIVLAVLLGIFLILLLVLTIRLNAVKKKTAENENRAEEVKIVQGVRYSKDDAISDEAGMNITHTPGDFILKRNEIYRAEKGGELLPGVYTALSTDGGDRNFKLRVGGIVKNFVHGDKVVIGDGEEVSAVSSTVILR